MIEDIVNKNIDDFGSSKFLLSDEADGKYASLFKKGKTSGKAIGIFFFLFIEAIINLIEYYSNFEKIIIDDLSIVNEQLSACFSDFDGKVGYIDLGNSITVKFDKIIMNPPYSGSLHLKILSEVIAENPGAEIVNLSPIRWLQDPLAEYKKNSDWYKFENVRRHISSLEELKAEDMSVLFQALMHSDLGIYYITREGGWTPSRKYKSIVENILKCERHWSDIIEHNKVDGIRVKTQALRGNAPSSNGPIRAWKPTIESFHLMYKNYSCIFVDGWQNGKWWTEFGNKNGSTKEVGAPLVDSIKFATIEEAENFQKSCWTKFMIFCNKISKVGVNTNFSFLPFLPTYSHPWTDADLYKYFNLTEDEIKIIEEEIPE